MLPYYPVPGAGLIKDVVLVDQIKCLAWQVRSVQCVEFTPKRLAEEGQAKIEPLLL